MIDWPLLLARLQRDYSLTEIAAVLGCSRDMLEHVKRGCGVKCELGLKLLALHDSVTGRHETVLAVARSRAYVGAITDVPTRTQKAKAIAKTFTRAPDGRWA